MWVSQWIQCVEVWDMTTPAWCRWQKKSWVSEWGWYPHDLSQIPVMGFTHTIDSRIAKAFICNLVFGFSSTSRFLVSSIPPVHHALNRCANPWEVSLCLWHSVGDILIHCFVYGFGYFMPVFFHRPLTRVRGKVLIWDVDKLGKI